MSLNMDNIFADVTKQAREGTGEPNWMTPKAIERTDGYKFIDESTNYHLPIDVALAIKLLKIPFGSPPPAAPGQPYYANKYKLYHDWYRAEKTGIVPPAKTCPGLMDAGKALANAISNKESIAVYCDYDVDGTSAGEALRRGLAPYGAPVFYIGNHIPEGHGPASQENDTGSARLLYGYADAQKGFGLTNEFVNQAHGAGATILITLDCGTGQISQVKLAQSLGMKVIVVDHHNIADNPADFHINPKLGWDGKGADEGARIVPTSDNTGAQLSWKLAAATQVAFDGRTRPEHWQQALQLAGMGCLADMGTVMLQENRSFFWAASEFPSPGVKALADRLGEDATWPGSMVITQAVMNLPKRTENVSAADVGALMACETAEQAQPLIDKLLHSYEEAKPYRQKMLAVAKKQTGESSQEQGAVVRPLQDPRTWDPNYSPGNETPHNYIAVAILPDEFAQYSGYTGPVASTISRSTGKPAVIFAPKKGDQYGQVVYKFSSRNSARIGMQLGGLLTDPAMLAACTLKKENEAGEVEEVPVVGGHTEVVSGSCTLENIPKVVAAMQEYAHACYLDNSSYYPQPWDGADAFPIDRKVDAERLSALERQSKQLGPYNMEPQHLYPESDFEHFDIKYKHSELVVSTAGTITVTDEEGSPGWLKGVLTLDNGDIRDICYPADVGVPEGRCEWIVRLGRPGAYYLRTFHPLPSL